MQSGVMEEVYSLGELLSHKLCVEAKDCMSEP